MTYPIGCCNSTKTDRHVSPSANLEAQSCFYEVIATTNETANKNEIVHFSYADPYKPHRAKNDACFFFGLFFILFVSVFAEQSKAGHIMFSRTLAIVRTVGSRYASAGPSAASPTPKPKDATGTATRRVSIIIAACFGVAALGTKAILICLFVCLFVFSGTESPALSVCFRSVYECKVRHFC
jgi:hypothetical protein